MELGPGKPFSFVIFEGPRRRKPIGFGFSGLFYFIF
jgi:hypothetical protein